MNCGGWLYSCSVYLLTPHPAMLQYYAQILLSSWLMRCRFCESPGRVSPVGEMEKCDFISGCNGVSLLKSKSNGF